MKYFAVSDIHSCYDALINSLNQAGYDMNNENHCLIVCGDVFDRGHQPKEVYRFLTSIPKERRVFIKGNHEDLLKNAANRRYFEQTDKRNGVQDTIMAFANFSKEEEKEMVMQQKNRYEIDNEIFIRLKNSEEYKWITSDEWVDWYELNNYIFVHGFIPQTIYYQDYMSEPRFIYNPNWRTESSQQELYASRWINSIDLYRFGHFKEEIKNGKTLVCGHIWSKCFYSTLRREGGKEDCPIYYEKHLIAIDSDTPTTNKVNVLIIDGDALYDQYGNKLNTGEH